MTNKDYKQVEVTYKFYQDDNKDELLHVQNATNYYSCLWEIHEKCRTVWKYNDKASDELIEFARKINDIIFESGALE